jgi:hypothetical protein
VEAMSVLRRNALRPSPHGELLTTRLLGSITIL